MSTRRKLAYAVAFVALAFLAARVVRAVFPTEADRLAERIDALGARLLAGDVEAVLAVVDLERFGLRAAAMGHARSFGPEDAERLVEKAREAASWLPLERATLAVVDAEVFTPGEGDGAGVERAAVAVRLSFTDEGQRYADVFDLGLRRADGRWVLTEVRLRQTDTSLPLGGGLRRVP